MSNDETENRSAYRGRLAPTPSGNLHLGHALTFMTAHERAKNAGGELIMRVEDLDDARTKPECIMSIFEDLNWLGIDWCEGPDKSDPCEPYIQSMRHGLYLSAWHRLYESGFIYPSSHSRKDVQRALSAPHEGEREVIFPEALRPDSFEPVENPGAVNWRFCVPYDITVKFTDNCAGEVAFDAGKDFGDFLVWRKDGWPSYELAVVVDDFTMGISEVVRGDDLLLSTARQLLIYHAMGWGSPQFYHCPLVRDQNGKRLSKRTEGLSITELREKGLTPEGVMALAKSGMSPSITY